MLRLHIGAFLAATLLGCDPVTMAPSLAGAAADPAAVVAPGGTLDFSADAAVKDDAGAAITYTWTATRGAFVTPQGDRVARSAPVGPVAFPEGVKGPKVTWRNTRTAGSSPCYAKVVVTAVNYGHPGDPPMFDYGRDERTFYLAIDADGVARLATGANGLAACADPAASAATAAASP